MYADNKKHAFTLVEILIVVAILGILAAVVVPTFQSHVHLAKESAAKDNLRILRNAIDLYASQHNDAPPGYPMADTSLEPIYVWFLSQMLAVTNVYGQVGQPGTSGWIYHAATKTIKLDWPGNDTKGTPYYDY
jgi:prepilin-type N-terminal cleavage/methylation domain-containing protein